MNELMVSLTDNVVQCWGCAVFDRLFQIVSVTVASVYEHFTGLCFILFALLFTVFVINAIWQNMKSGMSDPWLKNSVQKVFINSIIALSLLGMGVMLPRTVSTVIFEPVAHLTLKYSQTMINTTDEIVSDKVTYQPIKITEEGIYRPELRDTIIMIMKTTVTQFQAYIKLGIAVMDNAFSWEALLGIGALIKHIILFFIGLYIAWGFLKIFFSYCCYFADAIIAMALFAFFFPLSMVMIIFKDVKEVPKWFGEIGKSVGASQIKNLISAIVTLGSVILTYTVIMVIVAKFFSAPDASVNGLMDAITSGQIYADDLNTENLEAMTLTSCIALVYVMNFIFAQIPEITKMIMSVFAVEENTKHGDQFAEDMMTLSKKAIDNVVKVGKIIVNGGEDKKDGKKDDKKGDE
jgi:hypothetical protein